MQREDVPQPASQPDDGSIRMLSFYLYFLLLVGGSVPLRICIVKYKLFRPACIQHDKDNREGDTAKWMAAGVSNECGWDDGGVIPILALKCRPRRKEGGREDDHQ